jgi:hypothetical protein
VTTIQARESNQVDVSEESQGNDLDNSRTEDVGDKESKHEEEKDEIDNIGSGQVIGSEEALQKVETRMATTRSG